MTANTSPIFGLTPKTPVGQTISIQNTALDGTGTVVTGFTAGVNGSLVEQIHFTPLGSNLSATVIRLFINNGLASSTPTNNSYYDEVAVPITTLSNIAPMGVIVYTFKVNGIPKPLNLPNGYLLNFTIGSTEAAGWAIQVIGADF